MASRLKLQNPPEIFYNDFEARKYTSSSRIIEIQSKLTEGALELLALPDDGVPKLQLDIGMLLFLKFAYILAIEISFCSKEFSSYSGRQLKKKQAGFN